MAVCRGQKLDSLATEQARAELVALEPETPIAPHCGLLPEERETEQTLFERQASQIVEAVNLACASNALDPSRPLHVWPSTRFGVRTLIDPTLITDKRVGDLDFIRRAREMILGSAAYSAGERRPQFMQSGIVPDQGTNIALEQRIAVYGSGQGYCISLTARQGGRIWQRSSNRASGSSPIAAGTEWPDAAPILRDAHALAEALRANLMTAPFSMDR